VQGEHHRIEKIVDGDARGETADAPGGGA